MSDLVWPLTPITGVGTGRRDESPSVPGGPSVTRPAIRIDPAQHSGDPVLDRTGTRIETIVGAYASGDTAETVCDEYGISRHELLVALWYAGTYGCRAWRQWAADVAQPVLAGWRPGAVEDIPLPTVSATISEIVLPPGTLVDYVLPDGSHHYYSTHCRCSGDHDACKATTINGGPRTPARSKCCDAPCQCWCHRENADV